MDLRYGSSGDAMDHFNLGASSQWVSVDASKYPEFMSVDGDDEEVKSWTYIERLR